MADRTKVYGSEVTIKTGEDSTLTMQMDEGTLEIANPADTPVGMYFEHSDKVKQLAVTKEEWRGCTGPIISDNVIEAVFELVEDPNLNREKAITILKEHGFSWRRSNG